MRHPTTSIAQNLAPLAALLFLIACSRIAPVDGDPDGSNDGSAGRRDGNISFNDGGTGADDSSVGRGDTSTDAGDGSADSGGGPATYKTIRILASAVSGTGSHTDFPVFVSLVDSDIHDRAQADGCDIAFYEGSTLLDFEIEEFDASYTATEARLVAWVRVPSLATATDTVIRLYYGLPCGPYDNGPGVWGENYELVWHLNSSAESQTSDSTLNDFDGTLQGQPAVQEGKLGNSLMLDGVDDRVEGPSPSELDLLGSAARTFSIWASIQHYGATNWGDIFGIGRLGGGCCTYNGFGINRDRGRITFSVGGEWTQNANWAIFDDGTGFDDWAHYAATYDGDVGLTIYANGQQVHAVTLDRPLDTLDTNPLQLRWAQYVIGGPRDEMRISTQVMSGDWIMTEYTNQNDPNNFYVVGAETRGPLP